MTYFKIFAISAISSLLFLSVFVIVAFDSENSLREAYEHYEKQEYYEARALLVNEDNTIPLADFYLYEAYLAREELGLKKSQSYLNQASLELKNKKSSTALEIYLNLALDAYLLNDPVTLDFVIEKAQSYAEPNEPWVYFFKGLHAYMTKDYKLALQNWARSKSRPWLSNWMKTSFSKALTSIETELKYLHSEIESELYWSAREKLENKLMVSPDVHHHNIRYLIALTYIKEGNTLPLSKRSLAYQKAHDILLLVPLEHLNYVQGKEQIFDAFQEQIMQQLAVDHFDDISFYISVLEKWNAQPQLEKISVAVAKMVHERSLTGHSKEASFLLQGLAEQLPEGQLKHLITTKIAQQLYHAIAKGHLRHIEEHWAVCQNFLASQGQSYPLLTSMTATKILDVVSQDSTELNKTKPYIHLWKALEKNGHYRLHLAQELILKAQRLWSIEGNFQKAINLIKIAERLPFEGEQVLLHESIERAITKTYRQAILRDHIHEFPFIQMAIKEFNLDNNAILDAKEVENQLADAEYLYRNGRNGLASAKALWVLQVNPENQAARKIAALTAYENGYYHELLSHVHHLNEISLDLQEAVAISKVLTNAQDEGYSLLMQLANQNPISQSTVLRLAYGHLINLQPDQSLLWLNKIHVPCDETLIGHYIASFQKHEWGKTIDLYKHLPSTYSKIPALKGIIIQALIAQGNFSTAHDHFLEMLDLANYKSYQDEESSSSLAILQRHLNHFDVRDFAGRYFLHVKHDAENALNQFAMVKNAKPNLLYERAELAVKLNHFPEAINDLTLAINSSEDILKKKSLALLGNIYLNLGFYHDSVRYFKELFALNPMQSLELHQSYGIALSAIHCSELAQEHLAICGLNIQNLNPALDISDLLKSNSKQYPESLTMNILKAKQLLKLADKSSSSDDLLLAYEIIDSLNEAHPYIPEAWLIKGKILSKLKFNESANIAFSNPGLRNLVPQNESMTLSIPHLPVE